MEYILFTCPLPPSVNESLAVVRGRLVKTAKARQFHAAAVDAIKQDSTYRECLTLANQWVREKYALRVDRYFVWPTLDVMTTGAKAQNWAKKKDATNRVKQLDDAISEALMIDDLYFFSGDTEKITHPATPHAYTMIRISKRAPRTIHDLWKDFNSENHNTTEG